MKSKVIGNITLILRMLFLSNLILSSTATAAVSNISDIDRYGWSENAGWFDFKPDFGGVTVHDNFLEGFVWNNSIGFVKLGSDAGGPYTNSNTIDWGVNKNGESLAGFGWSESVGWINFDGITIDHLTGDFDGYAWGENIGYIHLNNTNPAYKVASATETTGGYAWAENSGWLDFRSAYGGVAVAADHLTGLVWGENIGWVKLGVDSGGPYTNSSASDWGVNIMDGAGNLGGYAWSENIGWIDFAGVSIDGVTGNFDGYAWSENQGYIHFQNVSPAYNVHVYNEPPVANPDIADAVSEGGTVTTIDGGQTSVLHNDTDAEFNSLTAVLDTGPANDPSFTLNQDGTFNYTHDGSETTIDSFTYHANDGKSNSIIVTVTINITPVNDSPTGTVSIDNTTPPEDALLTASNDLADADGMGSVSYHWQRGGADISGATAAIYTTIQADVGTTISVTASYTDGQGTPESLSSLATSAVANVNDSPTGIVSIDNMTPSEGDLLTASNNLADADGMGSVSYQWQRGGIDISGATAAAYTTVQADGGSIISVTASYTDGQGTPESVSSPATRSVANGSNNLTVAVDDAYPVAKSSTGNILDVLANDSSSDTKNVFIVGVASQNGVVGNNGSNVSYSPVSGFVGIETFQYTLEDSAGSKSVATVTIAVGSGAITSDPVPTGDGTNPITITPNAYTSITFPPTITEGTLTVVTDPPQKQLSNFILVHTDAYIDIHFSGTIPEGESVTVCIDFDENYVKGLTKNVVMLQDLCPLNLNPCWETLSTTKTPHAPPNENIITACAEATSFSHFALVEPDSDNDGVVDDNDVCPGLDDTIDTDNDGVPDGCDVCSGGDDTVDSDGDYTPDFCDAFPSDVREWVDADSDGVGDNSDLCVFGPNATDFDGDGVPNDCDSMNVTPGEWKDTDGDGIGDNADNCMRIVNPGQENGDNDTLGDACDSSGSVKNYGSVVDAPHNQFHGISCSDCHTYAIWWQYSPMSEGDSSYGNRADTICSKCHSTGVGAVSIVHSSEAMGGRHNTSLGNWTAKCVDCHDPHHQTQLEWRTDDADNLYLATGTIGSSSGFSVAGGLTTFEYSNLQLSVNNAAWDPDITDWGKKDTLDLPSGLILVEDVVKAVNTFEIISVDTGALTLTIKGGLDPASAGSSFGVIYGRMIKFEIDTPSSVTKAVKFYDPNIAFDSGIIGGLTDPINTTAPEGLCQVCHTNTTNWINSGSGTGHNSDSACTRCHYKKQGFRP